MTRLTRLLTFAFAAAQFALPGIAAVADGAGALHGSGPTAAAHVEDRARQSCRPPHAEDCAVCRFLMQHGKRARVASLPVVATAPGSAAVVTFESPRADHRAGLNSRAPPLSA